MNQTIKDHKAPRIPQRFLRWYCKSELLEDIEGDIHEDFNKRFTRSGKRNAYFYYGLDVIRFFRPFVIKRLFKTQKHNTMFKINTRIAFRNLAKHKLYSFINITGLAIGIAACLIIAHYVIFQLSFDSFHEKSDRVFRVNTTNYQNGEYVDKGLYCTFALGPALAKDVPEIDNYARVHPYYNGAVINRVVDSLNTTPFHEEDVLLVDPSFLELFSFDLVEGNLANALSDPNSILLTESMVTKYFGEVESSVVGETMKVTGGWAEGNFKVTGVLKDIPPNSHLQFDFLLPLQKALEGDQYQRDGSDWGWSNFIMYAQIIPQSTQTAVQEKIADLMHTYTPEALEASSSKAVLSLQSIMDIHLRSTIDDGDGEFSESTSANSVYFLILIAAFILIIAWINFINLSTAKATERGMEIGIKKAMGAHRRQLITQFLTESFWINILSVSLALGLTYTLLPLMGNAIGQNLQVTPGHPAILGILISLVVVGPLLAGVYPAFVLSSFKTVNALKGNGQLSSKNPLTLRKTLVVFQFVISTLLIAGTFVVSEQLDYMQNRDTGLDMDKILVIKGPSIGVSLKNFELFKNNISQLAVIEKFSSSRSVPGAGYSMGTDTHRVGDGQSQNQRIDATWVDANFTDTYGMELLAGRDFTDAVREADNGVLISEVCLKAFNLGTPEEALSERLAFGGDSVVIRGVVKDHNWQSMHKTYTPSAFLYTYATPQYFSLRINTQNYQEVITAVEKEFSSLFPGNPLDYYFLDDFFNRQYKQDQQFGAVFKAFAAFAIFAACLGLFGLASYTVIQRAKEIGIRKVLGASSAQITIVFSKSYMLLILLANVVAIPIAYFGMKSWLQNYAFSVPITAQLFVIPVLLLAVIAALTISFQTIRAAMANPIKNLRSE